MIAEVSLLDVQHDNSVHLYLYFEDEPHNVFEEAFLRLQQTQHSQQFPVAFQLLVAEDKLKCITL